MRDLPNYAQGHQLCARIIQRSLVASPLPTSQGVWESAVSSPAGFTAETRPLKGFLVEVPHVLSGNLVGAVQGGHGHFVPSLKSTYGSVVQFNCVLFLGKWRGKEEAGRSTEEGHKCSRYHVSTKGNSFILYCSKLNIVNIRVICLVELLYNAHPLQASTI